jgi:drug/metabolite transporter (DMT)-like permease
MSKMAPLTWILIFATIVLIVVGQLLVKKGMLLVGSTPRQLAVLPRYLLRSFTTPAVILGILAIGCASLCWMVVISKTDLSVAYPFMSLTIVLVLALTGPLFGESVPLNRWLGVGIVCIGLIVASR